MPRERTDSERLRFLKNYKARSTPKMDGNHKWILGGFGWPPLEGPTLEEAIDRAIEQVERTQRQIMEENT